VRRLDAYIILDDVDLEEATDLATLDDYKTNGQTCIAAKRFIVHDAIYDAFWFYLLKNESRKMGDPTNEEVYYGSMARQDLEMNCTGRY
jgi:succinate-semialdehyde dehydrogenase/glutarate-semialdehyde dehydrogenase